MTKRFAALFSKTIYLAAIPVIFLIYAAAQDTDRNVNLTEEFHKVYPLSAQGRIEIENLNGAVHITGWDRNEVKVDAVKTARTKERLAEASIEIHADQNDISIRTEYPNHDHTFNFGRRTTGCDWRAMRTRIQANNLQGR